MTTVSGSTEEFPTEKKKPGDISATFVDKEKAAKFYTEESNSDADEVTLVIETVDVLSKQSILLLNCAWYGLSLMFLLMSVEVVPAQIQSLVGPAAKGRWLGGMVACGAAVTFFVSPIIGMQSDRSTFKYGKRRPLMFLATITLCIGLIGMAVTAPEISMAQLNRGTSGNETGKLQCNKDLVALRCAPYWNSSKENPIDDNKDGAQQPNSVVMQQNSPGDGEGVEESNSGNIGLYIVFYLIVTSAFAGVTVPYNALIADKSHPSQRGLNSGVMAAMILIGNVSGAAVGTSFTHIGVIGAYSISIAIVLITLVITIFATTEDEGKHVVEPLGCITLFCGFWDPLKEHDFRWVFITRFLMQQGVSTVTGFLEYWLHDMVILPHCWTAATSVAIMLLPMLFAAACSSIIFGIISDKFGRRKPIVITAAAIMSTSIATMIMVSGKSAFYIAIILAFCFGVGFGSFQSVDFALVMDVLPQEKDKAKDIAVWHQALILPNALATPVGGLILDYFQQVDCRIGLGYIILFAVTAVYFCLSGLFVMKIKRAR
ncbi:uncharacterized protein LOC132759322 [Ruditapes philippinarum]|uniref:uncharacterized protein LOC132759322 n=1 Tax=Ruditapes philippinarum TaxID=129788 RepID=UPI00295AFFB6|nr:uncharacterized protein LOC132759322 [Ruditapes philippinarum]